MNRQEQAAKLQEADREMQRVRWALAQESVAPADKLVLTAMALDAGHGSGVTLRDCRQIAEDIDWNPGQTEDSLRHLEAAGLIEIQDTEPVGSHALQYEDQGEFAAVVVGARTGWDPGEGE